MAAGLVLTTHAKTEWEFKTQNDSYLHRNTTSILFLCLRCFPRQLGTFIEAGTCRSTWHSSVRVDPHYGQICLFYRKYLSTPNFDRCGGFARWGQNKLARANTSKTPLSCLGAGQIFVRVTFYCVFDRRHIADKWLVTTGQCGQYKTNIFGGARQIIFWLDIWNCPNQSRFLAIVRIDP